MSSEVAAAPAPTSLTSSPLGSSGVGNSAQGKPLASVTKSSAQKAKNPPGPPSIGRGFDAQAFPIKPRPGSKEAPGFFADDPSAALRQRQELATSFGEDCVFESSGGEPPKGTGSSSESEEEAPTEVYSKSFLRKQLTKKSTELGLGITKIPEEPSESKVHSSNDASDAVQLDPKSVEFDSAKSRFANSVWGIRGDDGNRSRVSNWTSGNSAITANTSQALGHNQLGKRLEPGVRRLRRLQTEVDALCSWSDSRKAGARPNSLEPADVAEANQLSHDCADVAALIQDAMSATSCGSTSAASRKAPPDEAPSKSLWLPQDERTSFSRVQQLLELNVLPTPVGSAGNAHAPDGESSHSTPWSYQLNANSGWLIAAEAQACEDLEGRITRLKATLGASASIAEVAREAAGIDTSDETLCGVVRRLQRRLGTLHQVWDDASSNRLQSSLQLLSADIDLAAAEAKKLAALEEEEHESDIGAGLHSSHSEDTPAAIFNRLYEQVVHVDSIASRTSELERDLASQERVFAEWGQFSQDLADCEAQMRRTGDLVRAAKTAANKMIEQIQQSKIQFQMNVAGLEQKLRARSEGRS